MRTCLTNEWVPNGLSDRKESKGTSRLRHQMNELVQILLQTVDVRLKLCIKDVSRARLVLKSN